MNKKLLKYFRWVLFLPILIHWPNFLFSQDRHTTDTKYWLFFIDKGRNTDTRLAKAQQEPAGVISERAIMRRAKVRQDAPVIDQSDLPVYEPYLNQLEKMGFVPIIVSKWLNAASFKLTSVEAEQVQKLPFIKKTQLVRARWPKPEPEIEIGSGLADLLKPAENRFNYGNSGTQNELIQVTAVHNFGVYGAGIFIGLLDDGFDTRNHPVFKNMNVIASHDFINNDVNTFFEDSQDCGSQGSHGTSVLSIIGGFDPEKLIGPAFKADFALAKTEKVCDPTLGGSFEQPIEEDYWVAGIEWLERLGVDVVSSSLGYIDWYNYEDMDGNTAVTTIAADLAAKKGVVVVVSAGNEGNSSWQYISAPADGDSVIAVGAVYSDKAIVGFSSRGPTFDGRTKPDVMAMGSGVYHASASGKLGYSYGGGTSYSCPQVAGVAALILSAHPELTPVQVREALRATADQASNPNNDYGWGIIDAWKAIQYYGITFSAIPELTLLQTGDYKIEINVISNSGIDPASVHMNWRVGSSGHYEKITLQKISAYTFNGILSQQPHGSILEIYFEASDSAAHYRTHPYDISKQIFRFTAGDTFIDDGRNLPDTFVLYQNFPNPFDPSIRYTRIRFDIKDTMNGSLKIYNPLGQLIRTLLPERRLFPGSYGNFFWDGLDDDGMPVTSGIYYYQLKTSEVAQTKKLTLLRSR